MKKIKKTPFFCQHNVTDNGEAVETARAITQAISYIPYGEVFVEQQAGGWSSPYLFNAKELDSETGLYYYGARYLDPSDAMWLSVDPLWEEHAGMSYYAYCMDNPVRLTDPSGMVECDEEGNVVIDYTLEKVLSLIKQRLDDPNISPGAKLAYNAINEKGLSSPQDNGVTYRAGIATTDKGHEILVLTAVNPNKIDDLSNCAGISLLGGQAGTLSGYEADIILADEFVPESAPNNPGSVVAWRQTDLRDGDDSSILRKTDGSKMVQTNHLARRLSPVKNKNVTTERFITKNNFSGSFVIPFSDTPTLGLDNATARASLGFSNDPRSRGYSFQPRKDRVTPRDISGIR